MARKKKTSRNKKTLFASLFSKKKGRRNRGAGAVTSGLKITLVIIFMTALIAGAAIGLIYLDRYVNPTTASEVPDGSLKLIDPPAWLNQDWVDRLVQAAGGKRFPLDQKSAKLIAERLETLSWLSNVRVQTTPEYLIVNADYRRPVGLVHISKSQKVYLDQDMMVLEYIPVTTVPVIEIRGLDSKKLPEPGSVWLAEDAKAAVELLNWLYTTDLYFTTDNKITKPLLEEIADIDVSNFIGRQSRSPSKPHIVLDVKDGTKVYWGAAWGQAAVTFEADEKDKLARLYQFYMDHNSTLQGTAKYIELRWLQNSIPRPK